MQQCNFIQKLQNLVNGTFISALCVQNVFFLSMSYAHLLIKPINIFNGKLLGLEL